LVYRRDELVGNRLALLGAIVYLLEWAVIIPVAAPGPFPPATNLDAMIGAYADEAAGQAVFAGWFSLVLLGRIAFAVGVRDPLRRSRRELPLVDFAVGAMIVSVILEIASYAVAAAAASLADNGAEPAAVAALNGAAFWLNLVIFTPLGVFVAMSSLAMLRSGLFPSWLSWLGLVSGTVALVGGVVSAAALETSFSGIGDALTSIGVLGFWVWMLGTGILLYRRAGVQVPQNTEPA
jgi:hypothetical protein